MMNNRAERMALDGKQDGIVQVAHTTWLTDQTQSPWEGTVESGVQIDEETCYFLYP
jgi:hypothetical protein